MLSPSCWQQHYQCGTLRCRREGASTPPDVQERHPTNRARSQTVNRRAAAAALYQQGRSDVAATAIRRVASTTVGWLKRITLLPAYIEIMLAAGDVQDARSACRELEDIARSFDTGMPGAIAAQACGAVDLAEAE